MTKPHHSPHHPSHFASHLALATALAAAMAGCVDTSATGPIVVDVAASALSIQPTIDDGDPEPDDGKVGVVVRFYRGNDFVRLAANTLVTCNGAEVPWGSLGYAVRVPIVEAGGSLRFVHSRAGVMTTATVTVPPRPMVTAPAEGATLVRSDRLPIQYVASPSAGVRPAASDSVVDIDGAEQSSTGTAFLDVRALRPGTGSIEISQRLSITLRGTGFQSAQVTYTIVSPAIGVTWQ